MEQGFTGDHMTINAASGYSLPHGIQASSSVDKIYPAIINAQKDLQSKTIPKSARNDFSKYDYSNEEDILGVVKPILSAHDLALLFSQDEAQLLEKRGKEYPVFVWCTLRVIHSSGQWVQFRAAGMGQDVGDKGIYKAVTGAKKYAVSKFFNLASGDDPEASGDEYRTEGRRPTVPAGRSSRPKQSGKSTKPKASKPSKKPKSKPAPSQKSKGGSSSGDSKSTSSSSSESDGSGGNSSVERAKKMLWGEMKDSNVSQEKVQEYADAQEFGKLEDLGTRELWACYHAIRNGKIEKGE